MKLFYFGKSIKNQRKNTGYGFSGCPQGKKFLKQYGNKAFVYFTLYWSKKIRFQNMCNYWDTIWSWISVILYCTFAWENSAKWFYIFLFNHSDLRDSVTRWSTPIFIKNSTWAPCEQAKTVSQNFSFSQRYWRKMCVCVVKDYADTFQRSQQLRGHSVSIVNEIILLWKK